MKDVAKALFGLSITITKEFKISGECSDYNVQIGWFWIFLVVLFLVLNVF